MTIVTIHNCDSVSGWAVLQGANTNFSTDATKKIQGAASAKMEVLFQPGSYLVHIRTNTGLNKDISGKTHFALWLASDKLIVNLKFYLYDINGKQAYWIPTPATHQSDDLEKLEFKIANATYVQEGFDFSQIDYATIYCINSEGETTNIWCDYIYAYDKVQYEEMTQKIIDVLKADPDLNYNIKRWYFGEHDIKKPNTVYPFIDVKWRGGPVRKLKTGTVITRREIEFIIRCVQRHVDEDTAEKFVMENTELIELVLDGNPTLGGYVEDSRVTEVLSDSIPLGGFAVVGSMTRLRTKT